MGRRSPDDVARRRSRRRAAQDAQEEMWRTYYASIFNPARLNPAMMKQEMPKRYWRNLPEAALIPELIEKAQRGPKHGRRPAHRRRNACSRPR
jgi:hypothetical protein